MATETTTAPPAQYAISATHTGQRFHLYLVAYGVFRFFHEFLRATPQILGSISGYQVAALAVALLGLVGFEQRRRAIATNA